MPYSLNKLLKNSNFHAGLKKFFKSKWFICWLCLFPAARFTKVLSNFSKKSVFDFSCKVLFKTYLYSTSLLFFAHFGIRHGFGPWNPGFKDSRSVWNWLVLTDYNMSGLNPSQFMSRNLIFNTESQNFIIPGNFQKCSGTLNIA